MFPCTISTTSTLRPGRQPVTVTVKRSEPSHGLTPGRRRAHRAAPRPRADAAPGDGLMSVRVQP